jgi:hypothetical protein
MLSAKVKSAFNPEFSFETEDSFTANNKQHFIKTGENNDNNSDDLNQNDEDDEIESNDEAKQELESLIKKKDHLRLKNQSAKVKTIIL